MTHEVNNHVQGLILTVDEMKARLKESELGIDGLSERDQKIELAVSAKFDALKDFLRENLAAKGELDRHEEAVARRHDANDVRMRSIEQQVAVLASHMKLKQ
jgi:hypothetical protein